MGCVDLNVETQVWNATSPVTLKCEQDMKIHTWRYTQFSQFNADESLLLVSGVHPGENNTMGEIAIFSFNREYLGRLCKCLGNISVS
jgi:F-box and WD-40 domain protein 5